MATSTITENTSTTKTSSLFVKNMEVPGMGLGESSQEGTPYGWLTGSVQDDAFDITCWAMPVSRSVKRCTPAHNCRTALIMGA